MHFTTSFGDWPLIFAKYFACVIAAFAGFALFWAQDQINAFLNRSWNRVLIPIYVLGIIVRSSGKGFGGAAISPPTIDNVPESKLDDWSREVAEFERKMKFENTTVLVFAFALLLLASCILFHYMFPSFLNTLKEWPWYLGTALWLVIAGPIFLLTLSMFIFTLVVILVWILRKVASINNKIIDWVGVRTAKVLNFLELVFVLICVALDF